eukprot:scaffold35194_cov118-Isochrysis_galbana.AAC.2
MEAERGHKGSVDFRPYFEGNWIKKAFVGVSAGRGRVNDSHSINDTRLERVLRLRHDMPPQVLFLSLFFFNFYFCARARPSSQRPASGFSI